MPGDVDSLCQFPSEDRARRHTRKPDGTDSVAWWWDDPNTTPARTRLSPETKSRPDAAGRFQPYPVATAVGLYLLSVVSSPAIRRTPASLYARQYRVGAHATNGLALAVLMVWILSPDSVWKNSRLAPVPRRKYGPRSYSWTGDLPSSLPATR